jgi:MarR family transcriptional regulator, lower aerobic nicotinate degradation pathway regulator
VKASYKLLTELLPLIEEFEATNQKMELKSFLQFARQKTTPLNAKAATPDKDLQLMSNQLGFFLNYLFRFFKGYTKTALRNSSISTADDFIFLATLSRQPSMRKTDLIKNNMMETPSGIEVIKRLLKYKLVAELADAEDKRSVRLKLTEKGKKELQDIFTEMNTVGNVLVGKLNVGEIKQLHGLLEKLFTHHQLLKDIDYSEGLEVLLK